MTEPLFFKSAGGLPAGEIAAQTGGKPLGPFDPARLISGVAPLDRAGPHDLTFLDNAAYAGGLGATHAGLCLTSERFAAKMPAHLAVLVTAHPYRAFVAVARALFPDALRPSSMFHSEGVARGAFIHSAARLESGVVVDPGAVIGPYAEIGTGSVIGAGAAIGPNVKIGRDCAVGSNASLTHCMIGDRVILHPGVAIGQDGFGFVMSPAGHQKVPQVGRVIIQDDVEIGAGTTIDRGAIRDTVIGEGTKIDNLVQVGHNVSIGRHCVIAAQCAIAGSVTLEDFVALGGKVAMNNHLTIGEGAMVAACSNVNDDIPRGARWAGSPAKPAKVWMREVALLKRLAARRNGQDTVQQTDDASEASR